MSEEKQLTNSGLWEKLLLLMTVDVWVLHSVFLFSSLKFRFRNSTELEVNKLLEKLLSHIDLSDEIMPRKLIQAALGECWSTDLFTSVCSKQNHMSTEAFKAEQKAKRKNFPLNLLSSLHYIFFI